jgi:transposase
VTIMVDTQRALTGGVDTHADVHVAAVIDPEGGLLGVESFATNLAGYKSLSGWMCAFGEIALVGVEGTGSYGAGLARHLHREGLVVVEVDRPNRQERARQGKSDALDAIEAARAALSGRAFGVAKTRDGNVEAIRTLMVAPAQRTRVENQGRRAVALGEEGKRLDVLIARLVDRVAPELVELVGLGPDTAALLLIAAGDNPSRLRSEATWAKLCGVAPLEASSGKVTRHRLNRGGDRQANSALWRIVLTRMSCHEPTKVYVARRTAEGKSKREIMRVLKRYVAREVYHYLPRD